MRSFCIAGVRYAADGEGDALDPRARYDQRQARPRRTRTCGDAARLARDRKREDGRGRTRRRSRPRSRARRLSDRLRDGRVRHRFVLRAGHPRRSARRRSHARPAPALTFRRDVVSRQLMAIGADRLADAFEGAPTLLARLAGEVSPQDAPETVIAKAREVIAVITERERVGILNAHPRIRADART